MADALSGLPIERAFVVHGAEGWDEPTPLGPFTVLDVRPGKVTAEIRSPSDYGLDLCGARDLAGGDSATNARAARGAGRRREGPAPRRPACWARRWRWKSSARRRRRAKASRWRARPSTAAPRAARSRPSRTSARGAPHERRPDREQGRRMSGAGDFLARHGDLVARPLGGGAGQTTRTRAACSTRAICRRRPSLKLDAFDLIAEVKLRSPAVGLAQGSRRSKTWVRAWHLCARGRGRRVHPHRAQPVRWLAGRSRERRACAAGAVGARHAQGFHRRRLPGARRPAGRRGRRAGHPAHDPASPISSR